MDLLSAARPRLVALFAVAGIFLAGCGGESTTDQPTLPPQRPVPQAATAKPDPPARSESSDESARAKADETPLEAQGDRGGAGLLDADDRAAFDELSRQLGGRNGIAVATGGVSGPVETAGDLSTGVAWSTSKVPVAMAIEAAGLAAEHQQQLVQAITASDNAAAQALWDALGGGEAAAAATDAQLRAAGDADTVTQPQVLRSGFTAFGQTEWALDDQARFVAGMNCVAAGGPILELMGQTVDAQRWGLGSVGMQAWLKGGWGPGSAPGQAGGYLDRQMGLLDLDGRPVGVAIASEPADGSHETGIQNLNALARFVVEHVNRKQLPRSARC